MNDLDEFNNSNSNSNELTKELSRFQKQDWIFLLSLVTIYEEKVGDGKAVDFYNFCIDYYKPLHFSKI